MKVQIGLKILKCKPAALLRLQYYDFGFTNWSIGNKKEMMSKDYRKKCI